MSIPHDSWAGFYDEAYRRSFGESYSSLTDLTLADITERLHPPARLVDFGAGTGRLSLPLAELGYEVTAVEPSAAMLKQIEIKCAATARNGKELAVTSRCCSMEEFPGDGSYDGALCVFTVILYLLDDEALLRSFRAAAAALTQGGLMWLDIPQEILFSSGHIRREGIDRNIQVTPTEGALFHYEESTTLDTDDGSIHYRDAFPIRHWAEAEVENALHVVGFAIEENLSDQFSGYGSSYWLVRKK